MIKLYEYKYKEEYTYYMLQALKEGNKEGFREQFLDLYPPDQAGFYMELDEGKREQVAIYLTPAEFGELFDCRA
ncbi:hypothetical protein [Paenibacillus sp. NPDC058174]|uniref:hypothetical protein n=1 Tax=Paenibacillus sp. NPDC058174 TaxID=3346366 RepID=UPI0036DC5D66